MRAYRAEVSADPIVEMPIAGRLAAIRVGFFMSSSSPFILGWASLIPSAPAQLFLPFIHPASGVMIR